MKLPLVATNFFLMALPKIKNDTSAELQ